MESPCTIPRLQDQEGPQCFPLHNNRNLAAKKARNDFLSEVTMGLVCVQGFDDRVKQGSFQTLVFGAWELALLPWLNKLPLCCFSLIGKRSISPATRGFSSKEIQFGVPFMGWKHWAWSQCSESMRLFIVLSPEMWRFMAGGRQEFLSWA